MTDEDYELTLGAVERERSHAVRDMTLRQMRRGLLDVPPISDCGPGIPRTLVQFWHDSEDLPADVRSCMRSWDVLADEGVTIRRFDDESAAAFIAEGFGAREVAAFGQCRHPAMRSDFLRLCFVFAAGGLYVDADDVLLDGSWGRVFRDSRLKVQPLCYDLASAGMLPTAELGRIDLPRDGRIFYVNNNPLAAPAGHPVLQRALESATARILGDEPDPDIQSTTGPGNLTAALVAHDRWMRASVGGDTDFELLLDWERTAAPRWDLGYRNDDRNWRNVYGC